jgi:beta-glucosidase
MQLDRNLVMDPETLTVKFRVKNVGERAGQEIAQIYVRPENPTAFRPTKELKGFEKIELEPGEEKELSVELPPRAFAFFNTGLGSWHVETGTYKILIGASSRDIRLEGEIKVLSNQPDANIPERDKLSFYRDFPPDSQVPDDVFRELLRRDLPPNKAEVKGSYTTNTPLAEMSDSLIAKLLLKVMEREVEKLVQEDPEGPTALMIRSIIKTMPLRTLMIMGWDRLTPGLIEGLLEMMNGRLISGLWIVVRNLT